MRISEEAVEAAHSAMCEESLEDHLDPDWPGPCVKAIEDAAPILMAQAWDEGRWAWDNYDDDNPYRSQK